MKLGTHFNYLDGIIYAIVTAISFVFIDKIDSYINPLISLMFMALGATLWFNLINIKSLMRLYSVCYKDYNYILLTIVIAINWLASIYAPHYSDPFVYLAIYFIVLAICGFIANYLQARYKNDLISCGFLLLALICIVLFYDIAGNRQLNIGLVLGIIGGLSAYVYAKLSAKICKKNSLSSSQLLAVRFIPLCIILLILIHLNHIEVKLTFLNLIALTLMTIISLIIPVYFYQQAINKLGAGKSSIIVAFTPIITFILFTISEKQVSLINFIISIIVLAALLVSKILPVRKLYA